VEEEKKSESVINIEGKKKTSTNSSKKNSTRYKIITNYE
jgi:hypothetical protein